MNRSDVPIGILNRQCVGEIVFEDLFHEDLGVGVLFQESRFCGGPCFVFALDDVVAAQAVDEDYVGFVILQQVDFQAVVNLVPALESCVAHRVRILWWFQDGSVSG